MFATAMRHKWAHLAYVGLYSGAGRARLKGTRRIYETSALAVLRQPDLFTDYIFVDNDARLAADLAERIQLVSPAANWAVLQHDVNDCADAVLARLPSFSRKEGLLCFCFVDPFDIQLRFDTIRRLATRKMDFLILLMLGIDARRNFQHHLSDPSDPTIGDLIDCPDWRAEYRNSGHKVIHFILRKFDQAMHGIGYLSADGDKHSIRIKRKGVLLYHLAYYSRHPIGQQFWASARTSLSGQLRLFD